MSASPTDTASLRQLISKKFGISPDEIADDTALFSSGMLDSFHLVELISVLEKATGRRIRPGEINLENLDTPQRISTFLQTPAD